MNTRLKRLEFRLNPGFVPPQMVICLVDSNANVLYKMRLGPGEKQYLSLTTSRYPRRTLTGCLRLRQGPCL
jgi:hypothetical protein